MMYIRLKSFRLVLLCFILWKKRSLEKKRRPGPLSPPGTFLATCLQVTQLMAGHRGLCFCMKIAPLLPVWPCHSSATLAFLLGDQLSLLSLTPWPKLSLLSLTKLDPFISIGEKMLHGFQDFSQRVHYGSRALMLVKICRTRPAEMGIEHQQKGNEKSSRPVHPAARHFLVKIKMQIMLDTLGLSRPLWKVWD